MLVYELIDTLFKVMYFGIFARVLLSFFPDFARRNYQLTEFIYRLTDPIMAPIETFTSKYMNLGMIDISPMLGLLLVSSLRRVLFALFFLA